MSLPLDFVAVFPLCWLEDETVYSLCSRYHRFSANASSRSTSRSLFGVRHGGHAHDFPSFLGALVTRTHGAVGSVKDLVDQHTIAPFYLPLRDQRSREDVLAAMEGDGLGALKFRLGLLTSRFGASHPLKSCPACMEEDIASGLPPYWRRSHQFPGVWFCSRHLEPLRVSSLKSTGVDRFGYHLPDECSSLLQMESKAYRSDLARPLFMSFGEACFRLGVTPAETYFEPQRVRHVITHALIEHGLLSASGRLKAGEASRSLSSFSQPFKLSSELSPLAVSEDGAYAQLCSLRRPERTLRHPLRLIWLVTWLFGNWDRFLQSYAAVGESVDVCPPLTLEGVAHGPEVLQDKRSICLNLIQADGFTPTHAAKVAGVATATAMSWATASGLKVSRRPKRLKEPDREMAIELLRSGASKSSVSDAFAMSASAVNLLLRTEPGLYADWSSSCLEYTREHHRQEWLCLIDAHPGVANRALRARKPGTYAWLYRNDREWLSGNQSKSVRLSSNNAAAVDWAARDSAYAMAVDAWRKALEVNSGPVQTRGRVALSEILHAVPELRSKRRRLKDLPLTQAAITRAMAVSPR